MKKKSLSYAFWELEYNKKVFHNLRQLSSKIWTHDVFWSWSSLQKQLYAERFEMLKRTPVSFLKTTKVPKVNPLPHNPYFWRSQETSFYKTLWEKKKMLLTSIASFSHNVFYPSQNKFQIFCHFYFVVWKMLVLGGFFFQILDYVMGFPRSMG